MCVHLLYSHSYAATACRDYPVHVAKPSGARDTGATASRKVLICWKSLQIWGKSMKIFVNSLKIRVNSLKIRTKMTPNFDLKLMAPNISTITWRLVSHGQPKESCPWSLEVKIVAQTFFGKVWGNSGIKCSHPPKFPCSFIYDKTNLFEFCKLQHIPGKCFHS